MTNPKAPTRKMTYQEFLDWCDEDTWAEWVDGEVIVLSPAFDRHQDLVDFLISILRIYAETRGSGVVRSAPFSMKTGPELPGREPDLLFIGKENQKRLKETYLDGPADLVVEITSPESGQRDRGEKFYEYEAGGVPEYWLIDPDRQQAEFYQLTEEHYKLVYPDPEGTYHSQVVEDFWLQVDWLWQDPLPSTIKVLAQITGVDPKIAEAFEQSLTGID